MLIALRGLEHFGDVAAEPRHFRAGYEAVRPWPDADAETVAALRAARHLNILNFGLSVRGPGLDEFVDRHAGPIVEWMGTRSAGLGHQRLAGSADGIGRCDAAQDLPGLGDALATDLAGALIEHPVGPGGATGQQPQLTPVPRCLHRSAPLRCAVSVVMV